MKNQIKKKIIKFKASNNKEYKIKIILDSIFYMKKSEIGFL